MEALVTRTYWKMYEAATAELGHTPRSMGDYFAAPVQTETWRKHYVKAFGFDPFAPALSEAW